MNKFNITEYQGVGLRGPAGGIGPKCKECGVSTWVEIAGGPSDDAYHPNVDKREISNVDIVHDLRSGIPFHDGHAERIKFIDVFQYFSEYEGKVLLREILRVLKPGGSFYLRVGDIKWICERIYKDGAHKALLEMLFHSVDTVDLEGIHRWGYSEESLKSTLEEAGFINVRFDGYYNRWEFKMEAFKSRIKKGIKNER